jgi:signal transduction histidine kinase
MEPSLAPNFDLRGRKILTVDDDRVNLRILSEILGMEGYAITQASSGEQAIGSYAKAPPDLVLLDVMMPGIDGFETCRQLRRLHGDHCAPVIFITAKSESDDVVEGLGAGGVDYLPKPFKQKEVLARIRSHMHNRILSEQREQLVIQLSRANAEKNKLLGMAAHDLRNPLASIRGLTEYLREGAVGPVTAEQVELMNTIHDASQQMLALVNELLDVATIGSGELKIRSEPCDLAALIARSVALSNMEAARKKTFITFEPPALAAVLLLDPAKMRQVIDNLLSNAVKYSPPGSSISVTLGQDSVSGHFAFAVQDQGPGIPAEEKHRLFRDFSRLSAQPTGGEKSTGLGLAICRKIVDAHGGTIAAENLPGGGCEFRVTLPFAT